MDSDSLFLDFYGTRVCVRGASERIKGWLAFDFSYFSVEPSEHSMLSVNLKMGPIPENLVPSLVESMHSPEYVCYDEGSVRYVDYYNQALVIYDYSAQTASMYSENEVFLYEKLYLFILSRIGEHLDRKGIHRVHALGITYRGSAVLFLIPSHGGKSTLALSLLTHHDVKLLSEDTPLIDCKGKVHPFPLRLGIHENQVPHDVSSNLVRSFSRSGWRKKSLLHIDYFKGKIEHKEAAAKILIIGKWSYSSSPKIEKVSRIKAFNTLLRDCVFGLGLPQIVEYFLTTNKKDLLSKVRIVLLRVIAVMGLVVRSQAYQVYLSRDLGSNQKLLLQFLEERLLP